LDSGWQQFGAAYLQSGGVAAGLAWIGMLTSLNVAAQMASPGWVKARPLAVYILEFQGAMTGGSILWGSLAAATSVPTALVFAAAGEAAALILAFRWRLPQDSATDLSPSNHWGRTGGIRPVGRRPRAGSHRDRISGRARATFRIRLRAARFRSSRQRDGAIRWDVWEDVAEPGRIVESFVVESWVEHQRQHARVTHADLRDQQLLQAFHVGDRPPVVWHLLRPL
jgi:hypothetical protein